MRILKYVSAYFSTVFYFDIVSEKYRLFFTKGRYFLFALADCQALSRGFATSDAI